MIIATATLWAVALGLVMYAWQLGDGSLVHGIEGGWGIMRRTILLLIIAFLIVGFVNVLSLQDLVQKWIGPQSGWQGLILGEGIGMLLPGGPYVVFPLIASLYQAGAGLGPAVALITSWAVLGSVSVTFELPFMGWRFTAVRWGLGLLAPLLTGLLALLLFR